MEEERIVWASGEYEEIGSAIDKIQYHSSIFPNADRNVVNKCLAKIQSINNKYGTQIMKEDKLKKRLQELAGIESVQETEGKRVDPWNHSNIKTTWKSEDDIVDDILDFLSEIESRNGEDAALELGKVIQNAVDQWGSTRGEDPFL